MTAATAIKYAGYLLQIIGGLRTLCETKGMEPAEFDRQMSAECKRLDKFQAEVNTAVDGVFSSATHDND